MPQEPRSGKIIKLRSTIYNQAIKLVQVTKVIMVAKVTKYVHPHHCINPWLDRH